MAQTVDPSSIRVALLAGGTSGEREISLASGEGAGEALRAAGFIVEAFDPASREDLKKLIDGNFDVAFLCLHGKGGEDGCLQGFLETIGLPYTGPGVWASATAMNKAKSKLFYLQAGIPTAPFTYLERGAAYDAASIAEKMNGQCVVKPATEGSALGIYIVEGAAEIASAIEAVHEIDDLVIVERFIEGRGARRLPLLCSETRIRMPSPSSKSCLVVNSMTSIQSMLPGDHSIFALLVLMRRQRPMCRIWPRGHTKPLSALAFRVRTLSWTLKGRRGFSRPIRFPA